MQHRICRGKYARPYRAVCNRAVALARRYHEPAEVVRDGNGDFHAMLDRRATHIPWYRHYYWVNARRA